MDGGRKGLGPMWRKAREVRSGDLRPLACSWADGPKQVGRFAAPPSLFQHWTGSPLVLPNPAHPRACECAAKTGLPRWTGRIIRLGCGASARRRRL